MTAKIRALVGCQNESCAEEVSYPLDMVRKLNGQPICQSCYEDGDWVERDEDGNPKVDWYDLPDVCLADLSE